MRQSGIVLVFIAAASPALLLSQDPPPIERAASPKPETPGRVWLVPGLPLGPHKPDPSGATIAFIDSGIQADHPQLKGLVVNARDFTGEGLQDDFQHGTMAALSSLKTTPDETAAVEKEMPGVDPASLTPGLISAKVIGKKPVSNPVLAQRIVDAIQWLGTLKVTLVNVSLALTGDDKDFAPVCAAIATQKDSLFIVSAGNGGPQDVVYPAKCKAENEVVVGDTNREGKVASHSGLGDVYASGTLELVQPFEYHRLEGDRLSREAKYAEAKKEYAESLAESPPLDTKAKIEYGLGFVSQKTGQPDLAVEHFRAAARDAPGFAEAYVAASVVLAGRKNFQAARDLLQGAIAAGADSPRLRDRLARVLLDLKLPREALEQIDALEKLDPNFDGLGELKLAARNRVLLLNSLQNGGNPRQLFEAILESGDGGLAVFLAQNAKIDLNATPAGAQVPPIVRAASLGQTSLVEALLDAGAQVDARDSKNQITALMAAANTGQTGIVRRLLEAKASIDLTDDFGYTPLMFAAEQGRLECARLLLDHHARLDPVSHEGLTALDYAKRYGHTDIEAVIADAGKRGAKEPQDKSGPR